MVEPPLLPLLPTSPRNPCTQTNYTQYYLVGGTTSKHGACATAPCPVCCSRAGKTRWWRAVDASPLLPAYDKTGWPLSVVVRVVVTKQGCLVRKAGQRTVRLTVAPGSWIARTHLLFLLLFLRNTLIENPLDPSNHSITCSTRVVYYTGLGEKRETDLVRCGGGA